jgi:hypothetical protein
MDAWEDKAPTFPTSSSVGGGEVVMFAAVPSTPESHPMGEEMEEESSLGWHFDFLCNTNSEPTMRLCSRPAMVQARKPPAQCGYTGEYTRPDLRVMLAENSLRRRNTRCSGLIPTLVNMPVFAMPRTYLLRGWHIYPAVDTHLQPQSSTSTTLLFSIPGQ